MAAASLLDTVAEHETALVARLDQARSDARKQVEEAQIEAGSILSEALRRQDEELIALRHGAARERESQAAAIETASRERVEAIRQHAADKITQIRDEVVARILPAPART